MTKQLDRGANLPIGLVIGASLALLVAFLLIGCSLKGYGRGRVLSLDIDALLGASPADFDFRLKEMADARLVGEERWEVDKIPKGYTGDLQDIIGTVSRRVYEIVFADTDWRPRVDAYFHYNSARTSSIDVHFDKYVRMLDALSQIGFDLPDLRESRVGTYTWTARTAGRKWRIYPMELKGIDISIPPTGETELCFINWWEPKNSRKTLVSAWIHGQ